MSTITLHTHRYDYNLNDPAQKTAYTELSARLKAQGYKCFDAIGDFKELSIPDTVAVDTSYIFDNQINTLCGLRVFDWRELALFDQFGRRTAHRTGYYLTGMEPLWALRDSTLTCGYCGALYPKDGAPQWCSKCLGCEYLTEKELPRLYLIPVSQKRDYTLDAAPIKAAWEAERPRLMARLESERKARLIAKADKLERDLITENAQRENETKILCCLLRAGISTDNLIYYIHTNNWTFGWRNKILESERSAIIEKLRAIEDQLPDLWIQSLEWKMQRDEKGFTK